MTNFCRDIPAPIKDLTKTIQAAGWQAYVVGGAVRDLLLGRAIAEWDVCTSARPEEVSRLFPRVIPTGLKHGTVTVLTADEHPVEVTTYRLELAYSDGRHPDHVEFTDDLEADLSRRDFTMNAMALDPETGDLRDPFGGREDLGKRLIRTVGTAIDRFREDGLRPIRAIRFAAQLGFTIEAEALSAIPRSRDVVEKVAVERLREEFIKILKAPKPSVGLELLRSTGLLDLFIPELLEGVGCDQNDYHAYDVYEHSLKACDFLEGEPLLRLAALLHDVGKPRTRQFLRGANRFYGHDHVGARMSESILERLRFSHADRDYVVNLVHNHMFYYRDDWTDGTVRRFLRRVGEENVEPLITLRIADEKASGVNAPDYERVDLLRAHIAKVREKSLILTVKDLAIDGQTLMKELQLKPGPQLGEILRGLLEKVVDDPELNEQGKLLTLAKEHVRRSSQENSSS